MQKWTSIFPKGNGCLLEARPLIRCSKGLLANAITITAFYLAAIVLSNPQP